MLNNSRFTQKLQTVQSFDILLTSHVNIFTPQSGFQNQRVTIGAALLTKPAVPDSSDSVPGSCGVPLCTQLSVALLLPSVTVPWSFFILHNPDTFIVTLSSAP